LSIIKIKQTSIAKMVALEVIQASNSKIAKTLASGFVAVFLGATQGIGQATLQHFVKNAPPSSHIYTVARSSSLAAHETFVASLREEKPDSTIEVIEADVSLISEIDKIAQVIKKKETKVDLLAISAGFIAFEGRKNTREGLDPSMTTRYYSRLRAVQLLLPLLNNAPAPRIFSTLAGGMEGQLIEDDMDLRGEGKWEVWTSSVQSTTMQTLALERFARLHPNLSIIHWFPGPVKTALLDRAYASGMKTYPDVMSADESGVRGLFYATSDRYAVKSGLVPVPEGLEVVKTSGGGIFLLDPQGEATDNEKVLAPQRESGAQERLWKFTEEIYAAATA
jgi:NAD(P)-dependent dehydrogenase (short-subunit alcohol dehydrogenase family)